MRILWITTFPPRRCGIGDYAYDLVSHLAQDGRLELGVLTYPDGVTREAVPASGFEIRRRLRAQLSAGRLASEIADFRPDVVHFQSSSFLHRPTVNRAVERANGTPLVTTAHDVPRSWRIFYVIPSLRGIYAKSSRMIVLSRRVAHVLEGFHHVNPARITTMLHGVDIRRYHPGADGREVRRLHGLDGRRVVLFFGFLRPGKGLETLLRAWSRVQSEVSDTVLVIAGGAPSGARRYGLLLQDETAYPEKLRQLARDLHIADRVVFTGYVPEADVPGLLASSEVIVLPYDANEAQSGPFFKALSSGRPVIATAVPGFQDVVENGKEAVLVEPRDEESLAASIRELLQDSDRARDVGRRGREMAERSFDFSVLAGSTRRIYEDVLAK